jgi:hypothetical protein
LKPEFATNRPGERVADALTGYFDHLIASWRDPFDLAIATAYFNPGGFALLANQLEQAGSIRLLLGAEPKSDLARVRHLSRDVAPTRADGLRLEEALRALEDDVITDRNLLGFTAETDALLERLVAWLDSESVQVHRYVNGFMHGKTFLVTTSDDGAIAGSSNFTYAGLARNIELNLGQYQPLVVERVRKWFDELWKDSQTYPLADLYRARFAPYNPYVVYLRMLYERYGAEVEDQAQQEGTGLRLTTFQQDGVWRAKRILEGFHGVVIADGVGLGKSFIAGELIREAVIERRQRVLLITPAALRDGPWASFLAEHQLGVESVSYEELTADRNLNVGAHGSGLRFAPNEYALVVIDEAHAYRNPETQRASVLRRLLAGTPPKQLVLLTATPVNNTLWDLFYLLGYFITNDAQFAASGIPSLKEHFAEAMATDPDDLSPDKLFDVLDAIAVRRTRHFVKKYYPHDTVWIGGAEIPVTFPTPEPITVTYNLDEVLPGFFTRFAHALDCAGLSECEHGLAPNAPTLQLARYTPSLYLRNRLARTAAGEQVQREVNLAGLLRAGLLKRFESSAAAFALTCRRMAQSHDGFLAFLDDGLVPEPEALDDWLSGESDAEYQAAIEAAVRRGTGVPIGDFDATALVSAARADRDLLIGFAIEAESVDAESDPKLVKLADGLADIASQAATEAFGPEDQRDKRKVLIFSYFADTVAWIESFLQSRVANDPRLAAFRGRVGAVSGDDALATVSRNAAVWGFAPLSSQASPGHDADRFDILVSTDVLAEGVNLQQARHIINYDLPWNPMRLVQRHGRIDRIGSRHSRVFLRTYFPDRALDQILQLEDRLRRKIAQAASAVGVEGEILPGSRTSDVVFAHTREEIERVRAEDATLFETGGEVGNAHSGEEYRQDLRAGLLDPRLAAEIRALPWGSGSGMAIAGGHPGYVFCARVGDHPVVQYRFVDVSEEPSIVAGDTLSSLARARADATTIRSLSDAQRRGAYAAWASARAHILAEWQRGEDARTLQASIPKAMRDSAALLRQAPPLPNVTQDEIDAAVDAIEAPYAPRIQRMFRELLATAQSSSEKTVAILALIRDLGLRAAPAPEPLPVITEEDIHLVCWMGLGTADATYG